MRTERFDFDTLPDRNDIGCAKWNRRTEAEKAAGVVPMSIADMDFLTAPCVVEAVDRAARLGAYGYCDADAKYTDAVCGWMARRHGWPIQPDWIVHQNGVVSAMCVAVRAFTEPGDKVLVMAPGYYPFTMSVVENGRTPVYSELVLASDGRYRINFDDLREKAADPAVKMLFLCSPHNPVGRIWSRDELRGVAEICSEHNILVVSDEIHFDLELYGKHTVFPVAVPEMLDRCLVLTSTGKTFNLAGLQIANTIIPNDELRKQYIRRMQADGYSNPNYFGYHATIAAYNEGDSWVDAMLDYVRGNFALLGAWLSENLPMVKLLPADGTYLAWLDWRALGMKQKELTEFTRGEAMLVLNEGVFFGQGGEGFMRMNLTLPRRELQKALDRLLDAAKKRGIV